VTDITRRPSDRSVAAITLIGLLISILLTGCAASGVKVDEKRLAEFQKGKTTYAEVVQALGQPTSTVLDGNGSRMAIYSYAAYRTRPETFIPYIGVFVGGSDMNSSAVVFSFDQSGVLLSYASSQSQFGAGTGFAAGTAGQRVPDQPRGDTSAIPSPSGPNCPPTNRDGRCTP